MMHYVDLESLKTGLGVYYLLVVVMNVGFAAYMYYGVKNRAQAMLWTIVATVFLVHSLAYFAGANLILGQGIKNLINYIMDPVTYFVGSVTLFILFLYFRKT